MRWQRLERYRVTTDDPCRPYRCIIHNWEFLGRESLWAWARRIIRQMRAKRIPARLK